MRRQGVVPVEKLPQVGLAGIPPEGSNHGAHFQMVRALARGTKQMTKDTDDRLRSELFPRSEAYHPDWVIANGMGSNVLWLTEWLTTAMELKPGMRVLDLGCGRALSSIFLAREFGVQVWATDLWISAAENIQRIRAAELLDQVCPIHADARALPFGAGFFDAIVSVDSFSYYGSDDLYLNYLANFVKPDGQLGIAGAGLIKEFDSIPEHLQEMWTEDFWCLHSADWWRRHWDRTGIVDVEIAEAMTDGWKTWRQWHQTAHPDHKLELITLDADQGEYLGYVRMVGRRREDGRLVDYCWPDTMRSFPIKHKSLPLLRDG
jgi:cyclopropane fatty-acyl-phospholipid synthase-like methyltransferase